MMDAKRIYGRAHLAPAQAPPFGAMYSPPVPRSRSRLVAAVLTSGAVAVLVSCGGSSSAATPPSIPTLTITAGPNGYAVQPKNPLPAGLIQFNLRNNDRGPHQFQFATPFAGTTLATLRTTVTSGQLTQLPKEIETGLSWAVPPGTSQTIYLTY